ncbi:uncharacterized protein LOC124258962 [Haliotis rubra]|uniref:uncharacterized protein LOC124258962 n=1 Tax=Haliotis rubra TaxID=36100 RepID=UPI001EE57FB3|nr:uncharacterized protein LOC124258962 [Haliotis rubra]
MKKAKLAELLAEKSMFQARAQAEMKLKEVELDTKIAKTAAKEKVYSEADAAGQGQGLGDPTVTLRSVTTPSSQYNQISQQKINPSAADFLPVNQSSLNHTSQNPGASIAVDNQSSLFNHAVLETQRQMSHAMFLPKPEVPKFTGDPTEFSAFLMAFDARIAPHTSSEADRLYYLDQQLQGEPKDLISGCLHMDPLAGYAAARNLLCKEYGDPYRISTAYMNKIRTWPNLKNEDNVGLKQFSILLTKCYHVMRGISHMIVLNHAPNMQCVVLKLPAYLQSRWRDRVTTMKLNGQEEVEFKHLVDFIDFAARSANEPIYSKQALLSKHDDTSRKDRFSDKYKQSNKSQSTSFATHIGSESQSKSKGISCFHCKQSHDLDDCKLFLQKTLSERREYLKESNRCYSCYGLNHISKGCMKKRTCKHCGKRHPTALHDYNFQSRQGQPDYVSKEKSSTGESNVITGATFCDNQRFKVKETVLQPILPVNVRQNGGDRVVQTYAMLDNGSTGCFITEGLKDELQAKSTPTLLRLQTMNGTDLINTTVVSDIVISDLSDRQFVSLPRTFCKDVMPVGHDNIPKSDALMQLPGLKNVAEMMPLYRPDLNIGLLIGSNCSDGLRPLEVTPSSGNGPFAVKYKLGWTVNGPLQVKCNLEDKSVVCNMVALKEHEKVSECITP